MITRREFLDSLAVGAAGLAVGTAARSYERILGSNDRLNFAIIGLNGRAYAHLAALKANKSAARVSHVCDVDNNILKKFAGLPLFGVNLTMLDTLENWDPFAGLWERDSSRTIRPDITYLAQDSRRVPVVGQVRRGVHQRAVKIDQRGTKTLHATSPCPRSSKERAIRSQMLCRRIALRRDSAIALRIAPIVAL